MKNKLLRCAAAVATVAALALSFAGPARAAACTDTIDTASPVLTNGFAFGLTNTRDNASNITSANVAGLHLAFGNAAVGSNEKRGAPAATQQAIFLSAGRKIEAINRVSGCRYWSYTIPQKLSVAGGNSVRSSSVYYLNEGGGHTALVLAGDIYGNFYAVNAVTGNLVWSHFLGTDRKHHFITGGMQFYGGKLFVPVASKEVITTIVELQDCCRSHGMLQAINPYTGTIYWTYNTSERASYQPSTGKKAPNGMSIWGTPAIDPARNTIYIGTGQNLSPPTTRNSDSVIALDMDTGNEKWVFQGNVGDAYNAGCELKPPLNVDCVDPKGPDWDFGAPPILVHLAGGKDAVIAGEKSGVVYSLDPDTGAVNWSHKLGAGGALGGIHWGMATDGTNVYAAVSDVTVDKASALSYIFKNSEITQVPDATPGIYALKLSNGQLVWEVHPQHTYKGQQYPSIYSAALSVTNDVLFAGSLDGVLKAFRTSDGAELWSYDTTAPFTDPDGNSGHGGTIDSVGAVPAGSDLLVNSGYSTFGSPGPLQYGGGNALLVMRLPGA